MNHSKYQGNLKPETTTWIQDDNFLTSFFWSSGLPLTSYNVRGEAECRERQPQPNKRQVPRTGYSVDYRSGSSHRCNFGDCLGMQLSEMQPTLRWYKIDLER